MSSNQNIYIAVVDDDESVCHSMSRLLRAVHFQPITYSSAEAFLADKKHPRFDCLVLDVQLKGMSGLDLSRRLSAVEDGTPVIFITAHDDPEVRALQNERNRGIQALLIRLTPEDRALVVMRYWYGLSYVEMAEATHRAA